ncbi:MAG: hypothetical protein DRG83_18755 [Deltaproteobacteria bacterium]|nr:MAG: hypothetical protein DRG83_18755 [Deltaproteobacteria bacterium]
METKFTRVLWLINQLDTKGFIHTGSAAEELGVSTRTIRRYINEILEAGFPLYQDNVSKAWKFVDGFSLRMYPLNDEEITFFIIGQKISQKLGYPKKKRVLDLIERLTEFHKDDVPILIDFPEVASGTGTKKVYHLITTAIRERRSVDMTYYVRYSDKEAKRRVDPYGLLFSDGFWYLVGKCHLRDEVRVFALDAIHKIEKSIHTFQYPDNFNLEEFFSSSFGIYTGKKQKVIVQFYEPVARHILRRNFHCSQRNEIQSDGSVISSFEVLGLEEIKRWLYKWIPDFRILEPESLTQEICSDVKNFMKNLSNLDFSN